MSLYLNKKKIDFIEFPNKEVRLDLKEKISGKTMNKIIWKFEDNKSIFELLLLEDVLNRLGTPYTLVIPYMPYSRMDRIEENTTAFSLRVITNLFNNKIKIANHARCKIQILDPHSEKTLELFNQHDTLFSTAEEHSFNLAQTVFKDNNINLENILVVFPDKGAANRYNLNNYPNRIVLKKKRDFATGKITNIEIEETTVQNNNLNLPIYFIDDLCSYGGTFVLGLESLRGACYNGEANLIVTHSEEGVTKGSVLQKFDNVYTTDSIATIEHPKVKQYKILDVL